MIMKLARIIRYFRLHFFRDPRYFFLYLIQYFNTVYVPNIKFYDNEVAASEIMAGKSLIRLGDGEIYLLNHGDITFEKSTSELRLLMMALVTEYKEDSPYVLALNKVPLQKTNKQLKENGLLSCWLPSKVYFNLYFNQRSTYADAAMFYFKETIPKYFEKYLMTKQVIFVSNSEICAMFKQNSKIPFMETVFVETPKTNSFAEYGRIKVEVQKKVAEVGLKRAIVLAAFGPASKILAYELSKLGVQVLDVGQGVTAAYSTSDHSLSENIRVLQ